MHHVGAIGFVMIIMFLQTALSRAPTVAWLPRRLPRVTAQLCAFAHNFLTQVATVLQQWIHTLRLFRQNKDLRRKSQFAPSRPTTEFTVIQDVDVSTARSVFTTLTSRRSSPPGNKLRPVSPEELAEWQEGDQDSDATLSEPQPSELDEPWPFTFRPGESVWIRTAGGNWYPGKVSGQTTGKAKHGEEGLYYPVVFCDKLRKYFAPLNGEINPTPCTSGDSSSWLAGYDM
ncbi:Vacuolar protein sorting-associated protein [Salix suchowensis]|nr:Vacuolar protein sorting-associated protein [Salix suchowensis]